MAEKLTDRTRQWLGRKLDRLGLKRPLNYLRFSITRPSWWLHEQERRRFFRRWIKKGTFCFDVGANDGRTTAFYLSLGARVVAIEPQTRAIKALKEKLADLKNWQLIECAVGNSPGVATLKLEADESQIASLSADWIDAVQASRFAEMNWTHEEDVEVTTLDHLIEQLGQPDFLKLDVEGFEPQALAGLSHAVPVISFEYTPEFSGHVAACLRELARIGDYRFNLARHQIWSFEFSDWLTADELTCKLDENPDLSDGGDVYARSSVR